MKTFWACLAIAVFFVGAYLYIRQQDQEAAYHQQQLQMQQQAINADWKAARDAEYENRRIERQREIKEGYDKIRKEFNLP